jgi:23S rRNA (guanosine2251-2'-O)-methyltransferase
MSFITVKLCSVLLMEMVKKKIILILHDIRSAHNVGSILRSADGLGASEVFLTGLCPYPPIENDSRMPHESKTAAHKIKKTALGAEKTVKWHYEQDIHKVLKKLKAKDFEILSLEQTPAAKSIYEQRFSNKVALVVGNEIAGISDDILKKSDAHVFIPMSGSKESFNVSVATALAMQVVMRLNQ